MNGEEKQAAYNHHRGIAVDQAADLVKQGSGLTEVLARLASARKAAAEAQRDPNAASFGKPRTVPADEAWAEYEAAMREAPEVERMTSNPSGAHGGARTDLTKHGGEEVYPNELAQVRAAMTAARSPDSRLKYAHSEVHGEAYQVETTSGDGQTIPLTATQLPPENAGLKPGLIHTNARFVPELLSQASRLHEGLAGLESPEEKVQQLGRITWLLTNAMPYERGSASVAEWYHEAVNQAHGLGLGQRLSSLDLPAFRTGQDEYAQNYRQFFSERLHLTEPE